MIVCLNDEMVEMEDNDDEKVDFDFEQNDEIDEMVQIDETAYIEHDEIDTIDEIEEMVVIVLTMGHDETRGDECIDFEFLRHIEQIT